MACAGVTTADILEIYPTAPSTFPAGWAIHHALPSGAGTVSVVVNVPVISLLANYSIPVAIYRVN